MKSTWYTPPRSLAGVLAGIWSVHAARDEDLSARVLPDGSTCLVLQRDGTNLWSRDVCGPWAFTSVSGPRSEPFDFTLQAGGRMLIVQICPAGAKQVLGVPMSSLADRYEPLEAVIGSTPQKLVDQVLDESDEVLAVRAAERWLFERVGEQRSRSEFAAMAIDKVVARAGDIRVQDLAAHVNLSRRQLCRIMNERVGFSPKLFARIARFHHAVQLGRSTRSLPWVQVAIDAGYSDQAHMVREFGELGGIRPTDLRGSGAGLIW